MYLVLLVVFSTLTPIFIRRMMLQKEDLKHIFRTFENKPVCIKLLDCPLMSFLPESEAGIITLAKQMNLAVSDVRDKVEDLRDINPAIGMRGAR